MCVDVWGTKLILNWILWNWTVEFWISIDGPNPYPLHLYISYCCYNLCACRLTARPTLSREMSSFTSLCLRLLARFFNTDQPRIKIRQSSRYCIDFWLFSRLRAFQSSRYCIDSWLSSRLQALKSSRYCIHSLLFNRLHTSESSR